MSENSTVSTVVAWVNKRLMEMEKAPRMWGQSNEAIELLWFQLLEIKLDIGYPDASRPERFLLDAYDAFVYSRFGFHNFIANGVGLNVEELMNHLGDFHHKIFEEMLGKV